MSDNENTGRLKTILNSPKLRLAAMNPAAKVMAKLSWDIYENNPQLVVDIGDPAFKNRDRGWGLIRAGMEPIVAQTVFELIRWTCDQPNDTKNMISNLGHAFDPNTRQRAKETTPESDLWIGKDAEGRVYISLVSKKPDYPVIKFIFGPSDRRYHEYLHGNGQKFAPGEMSVMAARAYANLLERLIAVALERHYVEIKRPPPNRGNWNGNNQQRGNYQQNQPQAAAARPAGNDFGDDALPF